ncbi:MAG TPA: DUF4214 domain-containing protein [Iamia sp.]
MTLALLAPIGVVASTAAPSGAALPACTKTWTNTAGGSWDTAAGWSGGTLPTSTDHVCITVAGTYTVSVDDGGAAITVASLRVGNPGPGTDAQTLVVERAILNGDTALMATQGMETRARGSILLGDSDFNQVAIGVGGGAIVDNGGRMAQLDGQVATQIIRGDVVNTGTFRLDLPIRIEGALTTEGVLQVNHVLHVEDTMWTKGGTITGEWVVAAYDGLRVGDAVIGNPDARPGFVIEGGELSFESSQPIDVAVRGEVTVDGDTASRQDIRIQPLDAQDTTLTFTGTWTTRGDVYLQPGPTTEVTIAGSGPGATLVSEEQLERFTEHPGPATIDADLVTRGFLGTDDGVIEVTGDVEVEGEVGLGGGELTVGGDVDLEASSLLHTDVDGSDAGRLTVAGTATVDGVFEISTDTAPAVDTTVGVVTGASRTGTFEELAFIGSASWDPQYTATQVNLVRRASETASRRFVRAAYQDFLDRQPTTTELNQKATAIDGGTLTRASLVRQLSLSEEYVTALVQRFYADTLGRPGDPAGVAFWVDQLRTGRKTVAEVAGSFYASLEYFTRAGGTNTAWITDLYDVFFDRAPTGGDLTYWTGRITARGRTRVAIELFQSLESRRQRVDRLYGELLGRDGDPSGVDYWAGRITAEGDLALAVNLASSAEYLARAQVRYP